MSGTARLTLPFLSPGQAQKEFFHNEALQTLDLVTACAVEEAPRSAPPVSPVLGACYIVGTSPTGAWAGKSQYLAGYTSGGWRLVSPLDGMSAYVKATGMWANFRAGSWELGMVRGASVILGGVQVVGSRLAAIATPVRRPTVESEGRSPTRQLRAALRPHGLIDS